MRIRPAADAAEKLSCRWTRPSPAGQIDLDATVDRVICLWAAIN